MQDKNTMGCMWHTVLGVGGLMGVCKWVCASGCVQVGVCMLTMTVCVYGSTNPALLFPQSLAECVGGSSAKRLPGVAREYTCPSGHSLQWSHFPLCYSLFRMPSNVSVCGVCVCVCVCACACVCVCVCCSIHTYMHTKLFNASLNIITHSLYIPHVKNNIYVLNAHYMRQ